MLTASPSWLNDSELAAWKSFSLMHLQLTARLARTLNAEGLSFPDYLVLATLSDEPDGRRRIVELGRELGWEKSRVSHHLARMMRRGLIDKQRCDTDQRGAYAVITEFGRREAARVAPAHVSEVRALFVDQLSADQLASLRALSDTILAKFATLDTAS